MELVFLCFGIKTSLTETFEYFLDMSVMFRHVIRVDENFSFSFTEDVSEFVMLKRNIKEVESLCKLYKVYLNIQKVKTMLKFAGV